MSPLNLSTSSNCKIKDLFIIQPECFSDYRGENFEGYNENLYNKIFCSSESWTKGNNKFIVDSFSKSRKNVLRGFHGDVFTWKLIECLKGSIYFAVIDLRKDSETFGVHQTFTLTEHNKHQILVPNGCVNAHLCLTEECLFHYKFTHEYVSQKDQIHVKWNDPKYNVFWPIADPILSCRDK
jgi:dTDP-4-dehydrorhamnose 3,5-epimerase